VVYSLAAVITISFAWLQITVILVS
jgi:hypothetical protein